MAWMLIAHVGATLAMTGLIWLIQCVHYPLFAQVGAEAFQEYHARHTQWITPIVGPLMLVELGTAFWLVQTPPAGLPIWQIWVGLGLVIVIWASTALLQIPLHNSLGRGLDVEAIQKLVTGNWVRTIAWSVRSVLVLWWVQLLVQESSF